LVWYDNEYGYVHRMAELAAKVAASLDQPLEPPAEPLP
jgi:glyceraldehyde-3-phosphate dehydrogenase/erythrose-4-phosphate dehydrogenase